MQTFTWTAVDEFLGRGEELAELERWWDSEERMPMSVHGRRRCGKSWLMLKFADGKRAVPLTAMRTAPGAQLDDFAERLTPLLGVRPALGSLAELFRALYRAAHDVKLLVILDEFPYLLPFTQAEVERELTAIAAVMEAERDDSKLKLVLCGSLIGQMESLMAERGPLHGRLRSMRVQAVPFSQARLYLPTDGVLDQFERYAVAGGMPRYLSALAGPDPLDARIIERVLNPNAALWDEARAVLEQELREPKTYFAVLRELASGDKDTGEIASALRSDAQRTSKYLSTLEAMRLIDRKLPLGASTDSRSGHWHLRDPFLRFWFRFVFGFQADLESGLPGRQLYDNEIAPEFNDHVAPEFEAFCRQWVRANTRATKVGAWWGLSLNAYRKDGTRSTEEIDIVGTTRGVVSVVGEARWRNSRMDVSYLNDIDAYKIPALRQAGMRMAKDMDLMLFSRGGYTPGLVDAAAQRPNLTLLDATSVLSG